MILACTVVILLLNFAGDKAQAKPVWIQQPVDLIQYCREPSVGVDRFRRTSSGTGRDQKTKEGSSLFGAIIRIVGCGTMLRTESTSTPDSRRHQMLYRHMFVLYCELIICCRLLN